MVRRRRKSVRRARARVSSPFRRRSIRRKGGGKADITKMAIGGGLYGVARDQISRVITPVTANIPLGQFADEIGLLAVSWFMLRSGPRQLKEAAKAGIYIESASIGSQLSQNLVPQGNQQII